MAYGQGMIRDSIQNILNRRMQRGQEQNQGDLMERLRMQADMQTAKDAADHEWELRKQLLANKGARDVAEVQVGGRLGVEDKKQAGAYQTQGLKNEGFATSQRLKNEGGRMVQELVNSGQLEKAITLQQMIDDDKERERKSREGMNTQDNETAEKVAWIGANQRKSSAELQFGQGGSRSRLEYYKSLRKMAQDSRSMRANLEAQKAKGIASADLASQAQRAEASANEMIKELSGGQVTSVGVPFLHPDYAAKVDALADEMMRNDNGLRNEMQNQGTIHRESTTQPVLPVPEDTGGFFKR